MIKKYIKKIFLDKFIYLYSFVIPSIVMIASFASLGIYPGGVRTPLVFDLRAQQLSFFNYINNLSSGFNSLSYQSLGALGGGAINPLQMCCSLLFVFFRSISFYNVPWLIWGMIVFLVGLCGLTEFVYLKKGYPHIVESYKALFISICYALMSSVIVFSLVPVWIWGIAFLPLIALGVDKIIDNDRIILFVVAVSLSVILNYYIAYILVVFSVLYFLFRILALSFSIKDIFHKILICLSCGIISALISAFSWMPVLFDLFNGKMAENRSVHYGAIRNPFKVLYQLLPMNFDGLAKHSLPFIFCGTISILLCILYFADKKISKRERIISLVSLCVIFSCFCIGILDIAWMFFSEPNGYPSRYSFVFSFFVLLFASRKLNDFTLKTGKLSGYLIRIVIFFVVITDMYLNSVYVLRSINETISPYSNYSEYNQLFNTMNTLKTDYGIADGTGRTVKNWRYTNNDGILYGYEDIDYSSSGYNYALHSFLEDLGMNGQYHLIRSTGITPIVASILGVDTFIQYGESLEDYYEYCGSVDGLDIYNNTSALPIAFVIEDFEDYTAVDFNRNPFNNINLFVNDLSGSDPVYSILSSEIDSNSATVTPEAGKHLWMYAIPVNRSRDIHSDDNGDLYYVYENGDPICEYANTVSPYCVDLGVGNGEETTYIFDDDVEISDIYFASFNDEISQSVLNSISEKAAYDVYETSKAIIFSVDMTDAGSVLITKPYMNGYCIYVDGVITGYDSYRDALLLLELEAGHHDVVITYKVPGLVIGITLSLVTLCLLMFFVLYRSKSAVIDKLRNYAIPVLKENMVVKLVVSFALAFMISAGHVVEIGAYDHHGSLFGFTLIGLLVIYPVVSFLYHRFEYIDSEIALIHSTKIYIISLALLLLFYFVSFMALYPGIFAFDAPYQVQMYFSDSISEWHPVLHTVFLGKMIETAYSCGFEVMDGIALASVVQFVVTAICFSYLLKYVYEKTRSIKIWFSSTAFLGAFPTISLQTMSATKDSFFMAFFVLAITLTIELLSDQTAFFETKYKPIMLILSTVLMIINRNNCIYAYPILVIAIILACKKRKKVFVLMGVIVTLFVLYKLVLVTYYVSVDVDGREKFPLPAQQLAKIYLDDRSKLSSEEISVIENLIGEKGFEGFNPTTADPVKASINMQYYYENRDLVRKCYLDAILHNPKIALEAFADLTCGFWYPIYDLTLYGQGYKGYWVVGSFAPYYIDSKIPSLLYFYQFFNETDFSKTLLVPIYVIFAPATYFYIFIIMFGYALVKKRKPYIAVYTFVLAFWATYLFGPMALVRYTTYLFAIMPLYCTQILKKDDIHD